MDDEQLSRPARHNGNKGGTKRQCRRTRGIRNIFYPPSTLTFRCLHKTDASHAMLASRSARICGASDKALSFSFVSTVSVISALSGAGTTEATSTFFLTTRHANLHLFLSSLQVLFPLSAPFPTGLSELCLYSVLKTPLSLWVITDSSAGGHLFNLVTPASRLPRAIFHHLLTTLHRVCPG